MNFVVICKQNLNAAVALHQKIVLYNVSKSKNCGQFVLLVTGDVSEI